jgi:hypothetical protein
MRRFRRQGRGSTKTVVTPDWRGVKRLNSSSMIWFSATVRAAGSSVA